MGGLKLYSAAFEKKPKKVETVKKTRKPKKEKLDPIPEEQEVQEEKEEEKEKEEQQEKEELEEKEEKKEKVLVEETVTVTPKKENYAEKTDKLDDEETGQTSRKRPFEGAASDSEPPAWFKSFMDRLTPKAEPEPTPVPVPKKIRKQTKPKRVEPKPVKPVRRVERQQPKSQAQVEATHRADQHRQEIDQQFTEMNSLYYKIFGRR